MRKMSWTHSSEFVTVGVLLAVVLSTVYTVIVRDDAALGLD